MRTELIGKDLLLERSTMGSHKVADGLGGSPGDLADNAVYAGENSVLVIDSDREEVLDHKVRQSVFLQMLAILFDGRGTVGDLAAEDLSDLISNLLLV